MGNQDEFSKYDFSGWATKNDLICTDGLVIKKDAFKDNDGAIVPVVYNHNHADPKAVIGKAKLECRPEGVYAYVKLNDSENAKVVKKLLENGDIKSLSIWATGIERDQTPQKSVIKGNIQEVSVVVAGANPGATVECTISHSATGNEYISSIEACYDEIGLMICQSADEKKEGKKDMEGDKNNSNLDVEKVIDSMNEEQRSVLFGLIGALTEEKDEKSDEDTKDEKDDKKDEKSDEDTKDEKDDKSSKNQNVGKETDVKHSADPTKKNGGKDMKKNVFDKESGGEQTAPTILSHAAQADIISSARQESVGSFQTAMKMYQEENDVTIQHDAKSGGFLQTSADNSGSVQDLFPDYKDVKPGAPEMITDSQEWVEAVLNGANKSPMARIRTKQADIREAENDRSAKGFKKGNEKKLAGNIKLLRRTTDPHTVYVHNALHRDDVVDITDFDYVDYLYQVDRINLREELAQAILIGDGRSDGDEDKIEESKIRPIWTDDDVYTLHVDLDIETTEKELQGSNTGAYFGKNFIYSEGMVATILTARENAKGSGTPDMYTTLPTLNKMLLARDRNGRRLYSSVEELATALSVKNIYTSERLMNRIRTTADGQQKKLLAIIVNMNDYTIGNVRQGQITKFSDFDIKFNQLLSLLETRVSGAMSRAYSAIAIEENVISDSQNQPQVPEFGLPDINDENNDEQM